MFTGYHNKKKSPEGSDGNEYSCGGQGSRSVPADDEEQDEPSSSNSVQPVDELASFREKWQRELQNPPDPTSFAKCKETSSRFENSTESIEDQARGLFLKGVQNEQEGKLYEAVKFYRRAVQLVPDIETRLYEASKAKIQPIEADLESLSIDEAVSENSEVEEGEIEGELLPRLQRIFLRDQSVCQPDLPQNGTHMSSLPLEIVLYIMRWVVSSELDLRSLDLSCSTVCRGFYLAARDPEIWRLACVRVWGVNCGGLSNFASWRQMYIERPRVHFHGCYISKTTYIRPGENSFQDQLYRPWHLVEYFRYLRFFPEGLVLMLTTSDEPTTSLRELRYRNPRNSTVLRGHYRLHEDHVTIVLKREKEKASSTNNRVRNNKRKDSMIWNEPIEQTFHLELQIVSHRKHRHVQLLWQGYSVITRRGVAENTTKFDLISGRFPPFHFSRVKSYTFDSESVLQ